LVSGANLLHLTERPPVTVFHLNGAHDASVERRDFPPGRALIGPGLRVKPVIATGWSRNMDFMNVANSYPVRYEMVELSPRASAHIGRGAPSVASAAPRIALPLSLARSIERPRATAASARPATPETPDAEEAA
jgi:hypothetical protein